MHHLKKLQDKLLCSSSSYLSKRKINKLGLARKSISKHISEMPGSKTFPIVGSIFSVMSHKVRDWPIGLADPMSMEGMQLEQAYKQPLRCYFNPLKLHKLMLNIANEYGPITIHKFPFLPPLVLVSDVEDIAKMYRLTMDNPIRVGVHSLKKARTETAGKYFQQSCGLLVENDEAWRNVRNKVQTLLLRPQNIAKYLPQIDEVTLNFMDRIGDLQAQRGEMPVDFLDEISKWSLETIGFVTLNQRLGCLDPALTSDSDLMKMIKNVSLFFQSMNETELSLPFWRLMPTPTYMRLKKAHDFILRIADGHISTAEAAFLSKIGSLEETSGDSCLMESLLKIDGLSRVDALIMVLDMLMAGVDTTANVMGFTLYCLARNPKAQKRLHEELDSVLGDGQQTITEGHLARLSFTKACVKESLRLFPIVLGHCRKLPDDAEFGGYLIPKGHQIVAFTYATSKNESLFPRAQEYLPERWGRDRPLGPIHPFACLPFSHGPRSCIGRRIAEHEMFTFLARVMHRFKVDYKYEDMDVETKFLIAPATPLRFEFQERRQIRKI